MCEINSKTKLCIKQKRSSVLFDRWCQLCSSIFLVFHQVIKSQLARSSVCEVPYEKPLQLEFVSSAQSKEPIGDVWTWETRNGKVTKKQRGLKQGSREETKTKTWKTVQGMKTHLFVGHSGTMERSYSNVFHFRSGT